MYMLLHIYNTVYTQNTIYRDTGHKPSALSQRQRRRLKESSSLLTMALNSTSESFSGVGLFRSLLE